MTEDFTGIDVWTNTPTCPPLDASKSAAELLADLDALIASLPPRPRIPPEAKRLLFVDLARRMKRVRACSDAELAEMPSVMAGMPVDDYRALACEHEREVFPPLSRLLIEP